MKAMRFNEGKPDLTYLLEFPRAMALFCNICKFGEHKYGRGNFKRGGKPDLEYYQSAMRHLQAAYAGEDFDADSGLHHLGHAIWNFITLIEINEHETMRFDSFEDFMKYCQETGEKYRAQREKAEAVLDSEMKEDDDERRSGTRPFSELEPIFSNQA